ncbi:MAG: hypothetical protein US15_C0008G0009 [Candidatus Moranbacteria bacterium GW2011_GWF1_36_4]|nr:MAG: hypothetical protein US15_C0008G0009 [Candidatus Moranbacteria bacterium GW2011_GWF1_36_4]
MRRSPVSGFQRFLIGGNLFQSACQSVRIARQNGCGGIRQKFPFSRNRQLHQHRRDRSQNRKRNRRNHQDNLQLPTTFAITSTPAEKRPVPEPIRQKRNEAYQNHDHRGKQNIPVPDMRKFVRDYTLQFGLF